MKDREVVPDYDSDGSDTIRQKIAMSTNKKTMKISNSWQEKNDQIAQARDQEECYETGFNKSNIFPRQDEWKSLRSISRTKNSPKSRKKESKMIAVALSRKDRIWRNCDVMLKIQDAPRQKKIRWS